MGRLGGEARQMFEEGAAGQREQAAIAFPDFGHGVAFTTKGIYHGLPASGEGRGGPVLALKDSSDPYPLDASAKVGGTALKAKGTITNVAQLSALDLAIDVSGKTMSELYDVIGIALPETN